MNRRTLVSIAFSVALAGPSAHANFHFFDIQEVYSNADGSVQFIELFTPQFGQEVINNRTVTFQTTSGSTLKTFTFPNANGPSPTTNKTYLIGTSNLTSLYGVTPDYVIPANFLTIGSFADKRVNFASNTDVVNLASLPLDGVMSLNGVTTDSTATTFSINSQATPTNFAGQTATIPEPGTLGGLACGALVLGRVVWARRRKR
jgi:hypothetical protein